VVSTFNRAQIVSRCISSVLASDYADFELIVVDDGSSDGTVAELAATYNDPRLQVIGLDRNYGMSEARRVGTERAAGQWVIGLDSDWELEPFALTRLTEAIAEAPESVSLLCFRVRWDDGELSPRAVPAGIVGYEEKLRWWESGDAGDVLRCARRDVFESTPIFAKRRGAMDTLYELDIARNELATFSEEVLAIQHDDAANSWLRSADSQALVPRLRSEAPDMLWMAETSLERHGDALARWAPSLRLVLLRTAAVQAFILGQRRRGLRHARAAMKAAPTDPSLWATVVVGTGGPALTLQAVVLERKLAKRKRAVAEAAG
jgi:glycosyltransferase involved in cell wall biosynthesis